MKAKTPVKPAKTKTAASKTAPAGCSMRVVNNTVVLFSGDVGSLLMLR
jgi:hypothetical protein